MMKGDWLFFWGGKGGNSMPILHTHGDRHAWEGPQQLVNDLFILISNHITYVLGEKNHLGIIIYHYSIEVHRQVIIYHYMLYIYIILQKRCLVVLPTPDLPDPCKNTAKSGSRNKQHQPCVLFCQKMMKHVSTSNPATIKLQPKPKLIHNKWSRKRSKRYRKRLSQF